MRRDSDITRQLAAPAPGCRTRFVAIWSDLDHMIIPHTNARIEHPDLNARNVLVPSVGHNSLPIDGRVVHEICTILAHLEPDGSTVRRGCDLDQQHARAAKHRACSRERLRRVSRHMWRNRPCTVSDSCPPTQPARSCRR